MRSAQREVLSLQLLDWLSKVFHIQNMRQLVWQSNLVVNGTGRSQGSQSLVPLDKGNGGSGYKIVGKWEPWTTAFYNKKYYFFLTGNKEKWRVSSRDWWELPNEEQRTSDTRKEKDDTIGVPRDRRTTWSTTVNQWMKRGLSEWSFYFLSELKNHLGCLPICAFYLWCEPFHF